MRALVKSKPAPGLTLEEVPVPEIGPTDCLVRVRRTAICGTDLHIYNWDEWSQKTIPVPMTIGHEFCGEIAAIGTDVEGFDIGDRVSGEGHITCGYCRRCRAGERHLCRNTIGLGVNRPGCFADYVSLPAGNLFKLSRSINDDVASFLDPIGNATHTALSFDLIGEDVLITGAGPIGCIAAAICRHVGARHVVVTDVNDYRLGIAKRMGATRVINMSKSKDNYQELSDVMTELGMTEGFDVGLEMSGYGPAFAGMIRIMNNGGKIGVLGIPASDVHVDWTDIIFKGLILKGIYGREMFETWYKMQNMLENGLDVTPVLTDKLSVSDWESGFTRIIDGKCGKVNIDWST